MIFDYNLQKVFVSQLQLDDIGRFCIKCSSWEFDYYILTNTIMGKTAMLKFGPLVPEADSLPHGFDLNYKIMTYKEASIAKEITQYINDGKRAITEITELPYDAGFKIIPNLDVYLNSFC